MEEARGKTAGREGRRGKMATILHALMQEHAYLSTMYTVQVPYIATPRLWPTPQPLAPLQ